MRRRHTSDISPAGTDWDRLDALSEEEVRAAIEEDPDAHPTDDAFWEGGVVVMPERKESVTLRLDADLLRWFRAGGAGYQTRINAVLRSFVQAQQRGTKRE